MFHPTETDSFQFSENIRGFEFCLNFFNLNVTDETIESQLNNVVSTLIITKMDNSMERKFLKTTVAGILLEIGFQAAEPAALETLVEMLFSGLFYIFCFHFLKFLIYFDKLIFQQILRTLKKLNR